MDNESNKSQAPVPVVQVLSVSGLEYAMQTLMLAGWSISLVSLATSLINGSREFTTLTYPLSVLLVTLPLFAWLFIRLRRQEAANPAQKLEASRRRFAQLTQLVSFVVSVVTLISLVYYLMQIISNEQTGSVWKHVASYLVILVVAKAIFLYYWFENHSMKWGKK